MRLAVWIWKHALTCKEVTHLASQSLDRPLTFTQRIRMRLHFLICVWCRRYFKHLKFLDLAARSYGDKVEVIIRQSLPAEAKQRMRHALQINGGR